MYYRSCDYDKLNSFMSYYTINGISSQTTRENNWGQVPCIMLTIPIQKICRPYRTYHVLTCHKTYQKPSIQSFCFLINIFIHPGLDSQTNLRHSNFIDFIVNTKGFYCESIPRQKQY